MIGCWPAQLLERRRVGREAGLRLLLRLQPELVEEHRAQLLGGVDGERLARRLLDLGLEPAHLGRRARRPARGGRRRRRRRRPSPSARARRSAAARRRRRAAPSLRASMARRARARAGPTASARRPASSAGSVPDPSRSSWSARRRVGRAQLECRRSGPPGPRAGTATPRGRRGTAPTAVSRSTARRSTPNRSRPRMSSFTRWACTGRPPTPTSDASVRDLGSIEQLAGDERCGGVTGDERQPDEVERPSTPAHVAANGNGVASRSKRSVASDGLRTTVTSASSTVADGGPGLRGPDRLEQAVPQGAELDGFLEFRTLYDRLAEASGPRPRGPPSPTNEVLEAEVTACAAVRRGRRSSTRWRSSHAPLALAAAWAGVEAGRRSTGLAVVDGDAAEVVGSRRAARRRRGRGTSRAGRRRGRPRARPRRQGAHARPRPRRRRPRAPSTSTPRSPPTCSTRPEPLPARGPGGRATPALELRRRDAPPDGQLDLDGDGDRPGRRRRPPGRWPSPGSRRRSSPPWTRRPARALRRHRGAAGRRAGAHGGRRRRRRRRRTCASWPTSSPTEVRTARGRDPGARRARRSTSTPRRSCARSCSTSSAWRRRRRPRPASPPTPRRSRSCAGQHPIIEHAAALPRGREAALDLRRGPARRGRPPTAASTPRSTRPSPAPAGSARTRRTCTTSRCAREEGRQFRRAFVPAPGLRAAGRRLQPDRAALHRPPRRGPGPDRGVRRAASDIHTATAARVFGVEPGDVTLDAAVEGEDGVATAWPTAWRPTGSASGSTSRPRRRPRSSTPTSRPSPT